MTAGRGFIALAALIFGKWHPVGRARRGLLFGFSQALGNSLQTSAGVSADLVAILPYALTLIALVGLVGRSVGAGVRRPAVPEAVGRLPAAANRRAGESVPAGTNVAPG